MSFCLAAQPLVLSLWWQDVWGTRWCAPSLHFAAHGSVSRVHWRNEAFPHCPLLRALWSHYDNLLWLRMMPFSMGHNSFKSKPVFTSSAGGDHVPPPCWISPSDTWSSRLWFLLQSCMLTRPAFIFHEHALIFILNLLWLGSNRAFITCLALSAGVVIYTKL